MAKEKPSKIPFLKETINKTRAYKLFLKSKGVNLSRLASSPFSSLPISDKENYIKAYSFSDRIIDGRFPEIFYASSGSSGKVTIWSRDSQMEEIGTDIHEQVIKENFGLKKGQKILVVILFSMGVWVAGSFTAQSFRLLNKRGYKITLFTPGLDKEDFFRIFEKIKGDFEAIILVGYPAFLMDILVKLKEERLLPTKKTFLLTSGSAISENWRDEALSLISAKNKVFSTNIYGSADATVMGFETDYSIKLKKYLLSARDFRQKNGIPDNFSVFNCQKNIYFEHENGELVITVNNLLPLIRYNIHDRGIVLDDLLRKMPLLKSLKKPKGLGQTIAIWGRTDVATTFYSLNIYPENISVILKDFPDLGKSFSGSFLIFTREKIKKDPEKLVIEAELKDGVLKNKDLEEFFKRAAVHCLVKYSSEYAKLKKTLGDVVLPEIFLRDYGKLNLVSNKHESNRRLIIKNGKKPFVG